MISYDDDDVINLTKNIFQQHVKMVFESCSCGLLFPNREYNQKLCKFEFCDKQE